MKVTITVNDTKRELVYEKARVEQRDARTFTVFASRGHILAHFRTDEVQLYTEEDPAEDQPPDV